VEKWNKNAPAWFKPSTIILCYSPLHNSVNMHVFFGPAWVLLLTIKPQWSWAWAIMHPSSFNNTLFLPTHSPHNFTTFDIAYRPQGYCKLGRTGSMLIRILMTEGGRGPKVRVVVWIFEFLHSKNRPYWCTCIYNVLQSTYALKPGTNAVKGLVSNII
jgi:hypothetical protein